MIRLNSPRIYQGLILMDRFYVAKEEQAPHRQFGEDYNQLRNKVWRWL